MFAGTRIYGILGFIWFDMNVPGESYGLEGDRKTIAVFQRLIRRWRLERPS
jgi:hypothetical protein